MTGAAEPLQVVVAGQAGAGKSTLVRRLSTARRDLAISDSPDSQDLLRRMFDDDGAADAGLLVVDAAESVRTQSLLHGCPMPLLGPKRLVVVINKMDLVDYDRDRFEALARDCAAGLDRFGLGAAAVVPVSAGDGENLAGATTRMPWYRGPTVVEALDALTPRDAELPLRIPLREVGKSGQGRVLVGRLESGRLGRGDRLLFSPSNKTAEVTAIETLGGAGEVAEATAGQTARFTIDQPLFLERGEIASHETDPPIETSVFRARLIWLGDEPLRPGDRYGLRLATRDAPVSVQEIEGVIDADHPEPLEATAVPPGGVAAAVLRSPAMLALDEARTIDGTGRFALIDDGRIVGGGLINMEGYPDQRQLITVRSTNVAEVSHRVTAAARQARSGHRGGVLWFTGLSGAGKSTLAMAVEQALFRKGYLVYVLDGDNVRRRLNANLGFSPEDRAENIRRIGEVAALFADSGLLVVTAFISPYRTDRERAREAAGNGFAEIYIKADLALCEARDPKGLYKRARAGEIAEFTGISAPYEPPDQADLVVDTGALDVDACVERILAFVDESFGGDEPPAG